MTGIKYLWQSQNTKVRSHDRVALQQKPPLACPQQRWEKRLSEQRMFAVEETLLGIVEFSQYSLLCACRVDRVLVVLFAY